LAAGNSDDARRGLECGKIDADDAFHERRSDQSSVLVNELKADVSNGAGAVQLPSFLS
jgi:hypothetical protein